MTRWPLLALLIAATPAWPHADHGARPMEVSRREALLRLPDIAVTDTTGRRQGFVSRYAEAGPVLISFLYTACEANCTLVRAVMGMVDDALAAPGAPPLRLIVISVDPTRDRPADLARAAADEGASDRWDWLVASTAETPSLLSAFGLRPGPVEAHEAVYLLGDLRSGRFERIEGVPDPAVLVGLAQQMAGSSPDAR